MDGIATATTNPDIIYVATASGGVWKTTNSGVTWNALTDNQSTLFMGAIALEPSNPDVIYAGTGDANLGPSKLAFNRDNIYYGKGVLKSTDAGVTWTLESGNMPRANEVLEAGRQSATAMGSLLAAVVSRL